MSKSTVRLATANEIAQWDTLLQKNPDKGDVLQTKTMAEIKTGQGWQPEYWVYETEFGKLYATVLTRKFLGVGKLCYMLRGPGVANAKQFSKIVELNTKWEQFAFAIKMEPPITEGIKTSKSLQNVRPIQPNAHTILVDLSQTEEEILAGFRQRARREIRAAAKDGIIVRRVDLSAQTTQQMFALYAATGQRAGFFVRPAAYYAQFWQAFSGAGEGDLYFAYAPDEKEPVAGAYICRLVQKALYKDGGSRRSTAKHFAHYLQWEIMRDLKHQGVTSYDLHGVPPSDQLEDKTHPLAGLAMFKLSFSDQVVDYAGAYDQILKPKTYQKWIRYGQRVHQALARKLRKTTLY